MNKEEQEFIDEVEAKPEKKEHTISLLDVLHMELQEHMKTALSLKKKVEDAKTDYKKKYYSKKLKKNNIAALKIITAIERVKKNQKQRAEQPKLERDITDLEYTNETIGACPNCDTGNRPGPWHKEECPAYMPTENFDEKPKTDE